MTLSTTTTRVHYSGSGSTGPFSFPFRILQAADLAVYRDATLLTLTTDYSVTGAGDAAGGSVTLVSALASGQTLTIRRVVAVTQPNTFRNLSTYFPSSHEDAFDRLAMIDQQQQDELARTPKLAAHVDVAALGLTFPAPVASRVIAWDAAGAALESRVVDTGSIALPGGTRTVSSTTTYLSNNAVHNVMDYGAVGSNVAGTEVGDTAAFRAALAAAATYGGVVYLPIPSVAYRIDTTGGPLVVPPGIRVEGVMGRYHGTRIVHHAGSVLFDIAGSFEGRVMQDLIIIGGVAGGIGIRVRAQDTRLHRIMFSEYVGLACIETDEDPDSADGPWFCHFSDILVRCWTGAVGTVDYGIICRSNFNSSSIKNFSMTGCKVAGIQIMHGAAWQIRDGSLEHNATASSLEYGIIIGGHATLIPQGGVVDGIEAESNGRAAIHVTHAHGLVLANIYAYAPGFFGTADYGLLIEDASGTSTNVQDVTIMGGYHVGHDVSDIRIVGTTRVLLLQVSREDVISLGAGGDYHQVGELGARFIQPVTVAAGKRIYTDGGTSAGMQSPDQNSIEFYRGGSGTPQVTINVDGVETAGWFKHVPLANASLPAAGAARDGTIIIDSTNARIVYYVNGLRYFLPIGTSF